MKVYKQYNQSKSTNIQYKFNLLIYIFDNFKIITISNINIKLIKFK